MCIAKFNNSIGNSCVTVITQGKTEDCEGSWHTLTSWATEFNLDKLEEGYQETQWLRPRPPSFTHHKGQRSIHLLCTPSGQDYQESDLNQNHFKCLD